MGSQGFNVSSCGTLVDLIGLRVRTLIRISDVRTFQLTCIPYSVHFQDIMKSALVAALALACVLGLAMGRFDFGASQGSGFGGSK